MNIQYSSHTLFADIHRVMGYSIKKTYFLAHGSKFFTEKFYKNVLEVSHNITHKNVYFMKID